MKKGALPAAGPLFCFFIFPSKILKIFRNGLFRNDEYDRLNENNQFLWENGKKLLFFYQMHHKMKGYHSKKGMIPTYMILPVVLTLGCNYLAYYVTRVFTTGWYHRDLSFPMEDKIPFLPWTILVYWGCYLFWITNYVIAARQEKEKAYRYFCADFVAKLVCMFFFLVLPTTNVRPVVQGTGIFERLMRLLYEVDAADNLFPSIHCLTSWFCFVAVRRNERIPVCYRWISLGIAVAICISTLTTKQHVIIDVIGGVALAEGSYHLVHLTGFDHLYGGLMEKSGKRIESIVKQKN